MHAWALLILATASYFGAAALPWRMAVEGTPVEGKPLVRREYGGPLLAGLGRRGLAAVLVSERISANIICRNANRDLVFK
jgi:hypothetical protein